MSDVRRGGGAKRESKLSGLHPPYCQGTPPTGIGSRPGYGPMRMVPGYWRAASAAGRRRPMGIVREHAIAPTDGERWPVHVWAARFRPSIGWAVLCSSSPPLLRRWKFSVTTRSLVPPPRFSLLFASWTDLPPILISLSFPLYLLSTLSPMPG